MRQSFHRAFLLLTMASLLAACSGKSPFNAKVFRERSPEKPAPNEQQVDKSFFVDASGKPKTFLCGWAPEMTRGFLAGWATMLVQEQPHCNLEFEITESYLVGRMINASYPDDRSRWNEFIRIPIIQHFYYEKEKDSYGRETNKWIRNDRSHWSARPKMILSLESAQLGDIFGNVPLSVSAVKDIEWDFKRNFLGFTLNVTAHMDGQLGWWVDSSGPDWFQADYRVNFLEFKHNPNFKKTPYNQENSKYMNILHVMGRTIKGVTPELYAAHWDFSKPVELSVTGVPKRHQKTILAAVERWNQTFRDLGVIKSDAKAFEPVIRELEHPFDLRYPSLIWVQDEKISARSPLGIGMAHSDMKNGQILWGSVVIYGGLLERYVNAYAPIEAGSGTAALAKKFPLAGPDSKIPEKFDIPANFRGLDLSMKSELAKKLAVEHGAFVESKIQQLGEKINQGAGGGLDLESMKAEMEALKSQLSSLQQQDNSPVNAIVTDLLQVARDEQAETDRYFSQTNVIEQLGYSKNSQSKDFLSQLPAHLRAGAEEALGLKDPESRMSALRGLVGSYSPAMIVEHERTIENMVGAWNASPAQKTRTYPEMLEGVVMELALHELGHMLGLGHQFKENILPEPGSVPSRFVNELSALATEEKHFTNLTSVMGYRSGKTEMMADAATLVPGPHDELVIRYLYKGEYSTYDKASDDFKFYPLPASGKIPSMTKVEGENRELPVSYFPACNDIEASWGADPFCNRWDLGSTAEQIVKGYFEGLSDNLVASLFSLVGGKANPDYAEGWLWYQSLGTFSRVRLFYDEMRRRLRSEPDLKPLWNAIRSDEKALFAFSQHCLAESPDQIDNETLKQLWLHEDIRDLCRANNLALKEYKFFVNLPEGDYTRIDHNNRFVSGGYLVGDVARNSGHIFGSWYQMSNIPLKISSMYTMTQATPSLFYYGWLVDNPFYDYEEDRYLYRTLYPREYTKLVADTVKYNLRFSSTGRDEVTSMGRTVVATGWMVPYQRYYTNDSGKLPSSYNDTLNQQTQFQMSMVAVVLAAVKPDANSGVKADHYKKFTATVYDFFTDKSTTVRDVYVLPQGNIVVRANGMFIYPITKLKFYTDTNAYLIAYSLSYDFEVGDRLLEDSVKFSLTELHDQVFSTCIDGFQGSGLANYFDSGNEKFEGIYIPPGMALETGKEKLRLFYESIDRAFEGYETSVKGKIPKGLPPTMKAVCDESTRGVGQILASGALLNGYWLNITPEFLVK